MPTPKRPSRGKPSGWDPVYRMVRRIPRGKIATYGQIAALAGRPGAARQVGYALAALRSGRSTGIPWQRVMGKRGSAHAGISLDPRDGGERQRRLLEEEGIRFDARGRVALAEFQWRALSGSRRGP